MGNLVGETIGNGETHDSTGLTPRHYLKNALHDEVANRSCCGNEPKFGLGLRYKYA